MKDKSKFPNCDCLARREKDLQERTGDPGAYIPTWLVGPKQSVTPFVYCRARKSCKNGSFSKPGDGYIYAEFCPFCGKPLRPDNLPETVTVEQTILFEGKGDKAAG